MVRFSTGVLADMGEGVNRCIQTYRVGQQSVAEQRRALSQQLLMCNKVASRLQAQASGFWKRSWHVRLRRQ